MQGSTVIVWLGVLQIRLPWLMLALLAKGEVLVEDWACVDPGAAEAEGGKGTEVAVVRRDGLDDYEVLHIQSSVSLTEQLEGFNIGRLFQASCHPRFVEVFSHRLRSFLTTIIPFRIMRPKLTHQRFMELILT